MSYNPKLVGKSGGLGNSVFKCSFVRYHADGTGRDAHCANFPKEFIQDKPPKMQTSINDNGLHKKPNAQLP